MSRDPIEGPFDGPWLMPDYHEPAVRRRPVKRATVDWLTVVLFVGFTIGAIVFASVGAWVMIWLDGSGFSLHRLTESSQYPEFETGDLGEMGEYKTPISWQSSPKAMWKAAMSTSDQKN